MYRDMIDPYVATASSKAPPSVTKEEIEVAAIIGLYQAILAYDASKGVTFEVYAPWRIRGAITDEIRSLDQTSRVDPLEYLGLTTKAQAAPLISDDSN